MNTRAAAVLGACLCLTPMPRAAQLTVSDSPKKKVSVSLAGLDRREDIRHDDIRVGPGEKMKGDIATTGAVTVAGTVDGDVAVFGGPVEVSGRVDGDLFSLGGPVRLSGEIDGSVAALGGDVELAPGAKLHGDLALLGGKLLKAEGAVVHGSVANLGFARLLAPALSRGTAALIRAPSPDAPIRRAFRWASFAAVTLGGLLLMLLPALLFPRRVEAAAAAVEADPWACAGAGTLMLVLFLPGLLLLVVSVLGLPLIPLALLAWTAAVLLGLSGFCRAIAARAFAAAGRPVPAAPLAIAAGWLLLRLVGLGAKLAGGFVGGALSLTGFVLLSCGVALGLGAAWRTRMGGREA